MNLSLRTVALLSLVTGLLAVPAGATTARAISFDAKVSEADQIVLGKCVANRSGLDPSGRWIVTYSTFKVEKSMKGSASPEITVAVPGGVVGSLHQETVGIPSFRPGDERVLFVTGSKVGPSVLYFDQGTYNVRESGGVRMVQPVSSSLVLIDPQTGVAHSSNEGPQSLDAFSARVREVTSHTRNRDTNGFSMATERPSAVHPVSRTGLERFLHDNGIWIGLVAVGLLLAAIPLIRR